MTAVLNALDKENGVETVGKKPPSGKVKIKEREDKCRVYLKNKRHMRKAFL